MITGMDSGCVLKVEPQIGLWSVKGGQSGKMPSCLRKKKVGGSGVGNRKSETSLIMSKLEISGIYQVEVLNKPLGI